MQSAAVRRKPNCFNLYYQMQLSARMNRESITGLDAPCLGSFSSYVSPCKFNLIFLTTYRARGGDDLIFDQKAWDRAAQLAQAYSIGRTESQAALALCKHVPQNTVDQLHQVVRRRDQTPKPLLCNAK